jgi:lysozyme family protein
MKANFATAFKDLLSPDREGGFSNDPRDPGGMTNHGVTKAVWEKWVGHEVDEAVMRALTKDDVKPLYKAKYWDKINGDNLPAGVDYAVFDAAVNSGVSRAAKWLQLCVGVEADGNIGPKTLAAVAAFSGDDLVEDYSKRRLSFMMDLLAWKDFKEGWTRRVAEVKTTAKQMTA